MIKNPADMALMDKKVRVLIAGYPGIGKTTLGLSAPNPLHIDVDKGLDRVSAPHRKPFIQPENYEELLEDLQPQNLKEFETLVFDTGGQLLKLISDWAINTNYKNGRGGGNLSQQGYGVVGKEFENLMNKAYYTLKKNIVVIFHAKEKEENEVLKLRIMVDGMTKDNVWQPMDLGGFIEMQGKDRVLTFANNERHYGKYSHGIEPRITIPDLSKGANNDFFTKIFEQVNDNIRKDAEVFETQKAEYELVMSKVRDIIDAITDANTANEAFNAIKSIPHILTSKSESKTMLNRKAESVKVKWNMQEGCYVAVIDNAQPA